MTRPLSSRRAAPRPLDPAALQALALAYVGRYATTRVKLGRYLDRKLRERGWDNADPPDPEAIAARFADAGYLDDRSFATARAEGLSRRGFGARRVAADLRAAGVGEEDAADAHEHARTSAMEAALALARRRRIGPFAREPGDPDARRRAIATLVRGGHAPDLARRIANAAPGENLNDE